MNDRKTPSLASSAALWATLALWGAAPASAQPARIGLVIGNGGYSSFPALPACLESSRNLAKSLRDLGYQVVERQDPTSGALAAAVDELARGMAAAPDASVFVYLCGYAAGLNDRPFLLPTSASVKRPSDVMTQGLLAKAMLDVLGRGNPSRGLLTLDLVPAPELPAPALGSLAALPLPDGVGLIAVTAPPPGTGPTALSAALAEGLATPAVESGALLGAIEAKLKDRPPLALAALRMPALSRPLAADDEPPAPTRPAEAEAASAEAPRIPTLGFASEREMTETDRRRAQESLARLGYYGAPVDGLFGPETRAAIRRFQHEIGAEMTGTLTAEQAARLLASK